MSLTFTIVGKENAVFDLRAKSERIVENVNRTLLALGYSLQRHVQQDKLHGSPLHQRSGRLAASVHVSQDVADHGSSVTVGTNVEYARIHEYGGTINHPGGTAYFFDKETGMARWVPNADPRAAVLPRTRPHVIVMPERSFLRSALREMEAEIVTRLKRAVGEGAH